MCMLLGVLASTDEVAHFSSSSVVLLLVMISVVNLDAIKGIAIEGGTAKM